MNREKRRALEKKARNKNRRSHIVNYLESLWGKHDDAIYDGDRVMLKVDQITGRKEYTGLQESYRNFVESSRGKVFVVHSHHARPDGFSAIMELEGVNWTFWYGDLLKVENAQAKGDE